MPAEGAIFLTNYRIIFKGSPIDPFSNEHTITRAFPVTSITREKRFSLNDYVSEIDQTLKEGIQLRSNTLQLIRAAFDDEVTVEEINNFRTLLHRTQYPATLWHYFAFRGHITLPTDPLAKEKDKNGKYSTIKGFAKTTMKTVSKATGLKTKQKKNHKYMLPNMQPMHGRLSVAEMMNHNDKFREEDELSDMVSESPGPVISPHSHTLDSRGVDRLSDRRDARDYARLGLGHLDSVTVRAGALAGELTRVSVVNYKFNLASSLPALVVVPGKISDDSLKRLAKIHKQSRVPSITWRHQSSRALLLRGSSYHSRSVMSILRGHGQHNPGHAGQSSEVTSSLEAEQYLGAIIAASPQSSLRSEAGWNIRGSTTSVNSLAEAGRGSLTTPTLSRRNNNPFSKAMEGFGTLTRSSGKRDCLNFRSADVYL